MAGLQRSSVSFRRQGSSGLIWKDGLIWEDGLLSGDLNQMKKRQEEAEGGVEYRELRASQSVGSIGLTGRSRSGGGRAWRAAKVSPAIEPPSPKVSGCGFCGMLGRSASTKQPKSRKH